ncbi:MAG: PKD domain-containing protein [Flavitalea sp.]
MKTMLRVIFSIIILLPLVTHAKNGAPIIEFSADNTVGCGSVTATFTDESFENSGDPFVGWLWDFGDGTTSTAFSPTHVYTVTGHFNVTLTITAQSGWTGFSTINSFIRVGSTPALDLGPDTTICVSNAALLDATTPSSTYLWSDGSTGATLETFSVGQFSVEVFHDGCIAKDTINVLQSAALSADFSYLQAGSCTPIATQFTETSQACNGSVVGWAWDFGDGSTSTTRNPSHNYLTTGNFSASLTVTKNDGTTFIVTKTVSITGNIGPVPALGPDVTICDDGNTATLDAGNAGATYNWSTGENTKTIDVIDPGVYSVTITKNTCSIIDSTHLIVKPVLWSDFTFAKISGCVPVNMEFTDKSSACQSTIIGWYWDFGDGFHSSASSPIHTFNGTGQFIVKLKITDNNGDEVTRSKKVIITPPAFGVDLGADTTICFGETLTLNATTATATYLWSTGETSAQIEVMDDGDYSVDVTVDGCTLKDTVVVKTASSVLANWGAQVGGQCLPITVSFKDSTKVFCGQTISLWKWDFGDGITSTQQNPQHVYNSADSFIVKLTITSSGGNTVSKTKKVYVKNTAPVLDLPATAATCFGAPVKLDAGIDNAQYAWSPTHGLDASDIKTPTSNTNQSMWYSVVVTKCMVSLRDSVHIIVDSIPKPIVAQEKNTLRSTESYQYQWYKEGKIVAGGTGRTLRVDHAGYYSVKTINHSGCDNTSDPYFYIPVSGDDKETGLRIKCTPNPTHGPITILLSEVPVRPLFVTIIDAGGKRLFSTTIQKNYNILDYLKLSKGLYFVQIIVDKDRRIIPVVVQ